MRKFKVWAIFAVTVAIVAACTNEVVDFENNGFPKLTKGKSLRVVKVSTSEMNVVTRATATAVDSWTDGSSIGVSVYSGTDGTSVLRAGTTNVTYTYDSSDESWGGTTINLIDGDEGYVTAYYPYSASGSDPKDIPINATVDWMYAPLSDNKKVSYDTPQTTLSMRHANAQIIVNLVRDGYTSTGSVSAFSVKSVKFGQAASLNSLTGELSGHSLVTNNTFSTSTTMTLADDISSSSTAKITPIQEWFVPVTDAAADVIFKAEIDRWKFKVTTTQKFESGHIYTYTLAVANSELPELKLSNVSITDWTDVGNSGEMEFYSEAESNAIDLGLPSGLKWAQGNLGAEKETDYGLYYAWGMINGYGQYDRHAFTNDTWGYYGGSGDLSLTYDAANLRLGGTWRLPTKTECQELLDNCTREYVEDYKGTGVNGCLFTSKINGKTLFMVYGGSGGRYSISGQNGQLYYWTKSRYNNSYSYFINVSGESVDCTISYTNCYWGHNIRAVCK